MSYKTYTTDALVCGARSSNTADKSFLLFTRDAGMLFASAKSIREERSKHRFALQEFSFARVSLVYGRGGWRITGADPIENVYHRAETRAARAHVRAVVLFLRQFFQGEVAHEALFDETRALLTSRPPEGVHAWETRERVYMLRALHTLGYIPATPAIAHLLARSLDQAWSACTPEALSAAETLIQQAHRESHL